MVKELNRLTGISSRIYSASSGSFDPNNTRYRSCCCHYKSFTFGCGIFEIFIISLLLAGIIPTSNYKNYCLSNKENIIIGNNTLTLLTTILNNIDIENSTQINNTLKESYNISRENFEQEISNNYTNTPENCGLNLICKIQCLFQIIWIIWAFIQILTLLLMFYAIKRLHWKLMIPHIVFRFLCACAILFLEVLLIKSLFDLPPVKWNKTSLCALIIIFAFIFLWVCFLLKCQIYCCEFLKLSMETGYSVSRIDGPPTFSLSDLAISNPRFSTGINESINPPQLFITPPKHLTTTSVLPIREKIKTNNKNTEQQDFYAGMEIRRSKTNLNTPETGFNSFSPLPPSLPPLRHTFKKGKNE